MSEEFEESEVIFEDYEVEYEDRSTETCNFELKYSSESENKRKKVKTITIKSKPVSIPENVPWPKYVDADLDGDGDDGGEMVPPHVIVGRRVAGKMMAFSVCTGIGRTLKGRDLSEVRNSVLRMTGFLET